MQSYETHPVSTDILEDDISSRTSKFYCKRGDHFIENKISEIDSEELFSECETHESLMWNVVMSDEFYAWRNMLNQTQTEENSK